MTVAQYLVAFAFILVCVLLIIVILLQKGRGGGLSGAFGGVGGHSAFGAKTGDVFTWITVALTFLFVLTAIIGVYLYVPPPAVPTAGVGQLSSPDTAQNESAAPETQPGG